MAVTRLWPVTKSLKHVIDYAEDPEKTTRACSKYAQERYQGLQDVLAYAKDEEKTEQELFCEGINCNALTARDQFVAVKEQYDKTDGIQAYHGYLSFREQNITPEQAMKIGMEFAKRVWGDRFQVVVTTHLNTQHLHCHFVINSVSFKDGKRLHGEEKAWFKFRRIADDICKSHGLHVIEQPERNPDSRHLIRQDKEDAPTRYNIARMAINEAISISTNKAQMEYTLKEMGYTFDFNVRHKYWTLTLQGDRKPMRLYRLGSDYTNQRIMERLRENHENVHFKPFQPKVYHPKQYCLPTRLDRFKKIGGLYGLYLHYCYRLGKFQKNQTNRLTRVHPRLRADLMKLDVLTAQTTLLGKHHIQSLKQLRDYQQTAEKEIGLLTAERANLRNEIRRKDIADTRLSADERRISEISGILKELRKEVKLCKDISDCSEDMKKRLDAVQAEENGKENINHEHKR